MQSVFLVGRVWPQLPSRFRNASKDVACVQTSVPFRLFTKKCVHLRKLVVPSAVAVLAVSLSRRQDGPKRDESEEEQARRLT